MNMLTVFLVALCFSTISFAQEVEKNTSTESVKLEFQQQYPLVSFSEALFFLAPGQSHFSATPVTSKGVFEYKSLNNKNGPTTEVKREVNIVELEFAHSLAGNGLMIGAHTSLGSVKNETKQTAATRNTKFSGMSDILIDVKKMNHLSDDLNFVFGATVGVSLEKERLANSKIDGNRSSGGNSIRPFVSLEKKVGFGSFGGIVDYKVLGTRESTFESQNYSTSEINGNEFSTEIFTEIDVVQNKIGAKFNYLSVDKSNVTENDDGDKSEYSLDKYIVYTTSLYGSFKVGSQVSLVPSIDYRANQTKELNGLDFNKNESLTMALGVRGYF